MKSPFTGKEMILKNESRELEFRKEKISIVFHYYWCKDTQEEFTTTALDEINTNQVYNQYRDKYNLPFPEEIRAVRDIYGLPATKMSEILGFGVNSYRNYENGEVPSNANGKLIQLASDPRKFKQLVQIAESLSDDSRNKILNKIEKLVEEREIRLADFEFKEYLLDGNLPNEFTGYKKPSFKKLTEMVVYFTKYMEPWKTQMNKLLFYADFLHFKRTCFSMSGVRYRAINMGPVPNNYNSIFEYISNKNHVDILVTEFQIDKVGEQFKLHSGRDCNLEVFTELELKTLNDVMNRFKGKKTNDIINISHQEKAWLDNEKERKIISYKYAFDLNQIE